MGAGDGDVAPPPLSGLYALSKVLEEVMLQQFGYPVRAHCLLPARALDHGEG